MRFKCFLLLTGLALILGPTVGLGQLRLQTTDGKIINLGTVVHQRVLSRMAQNSAPAAASPGTQPEGTDSDAKAEAAFRHLDTNHDGQLSYEEMDDGLKAERHKWDANKDGFIDLNEFKAYFKARTEQDHATGKAGSGAVKENRVENSSAGSFAPELPPGLPPWFREYDTDHDGQIGLYEWKAAGQPIARFLEMDGNGDGFLTAEEVLWAMAGKP